MCTVLVTQGHRISGCISAHSTVEFELYEYLVFLLKALKMTACRFVWQVGMSQQTS